ncbi:NmrA-like family domain-containing protein 1 [Purpureocillium lavendulum]|uniref:NmrA-like family domain-containing protein 1 n=1 Tax=Purpureocillium lavendulum TaxID=1247861 RepID=A0AB34FD12_9HYPO|nr:NmrA-like family domain-containing protein 1 [Purpureocillium lavendulum]
MKFSTVLISIAAFFASAEACKCIGPNGNNVDATRACCREAGGTPTGSNDCPAGEISNVLSRFAACCRAYGTRSDCRCPIGCARKELEIQHKADGKAPPTNDEVKALLAKYEN